MSSAVAYRWVPLICSNMVASFISPLPLMHPTTGSARRVPKNEFGEVADFIRPCRLCTGLWHHPKCPTTGTDARLRARVTGEREQILLHQKASSNSLDWSNRS